MKKLFLVMLLILSPAIAFGGVCSAKCEAITVADTAIGFTAATYAIPTGCTTISAFCVDSTAQIRIRYDGTAPTTSVGHPIEAGQNFTVKGAMDVTNFKAIRTGATSGDLFCCYSYN